MAKRQKKKKLVFLILIVHQKQSLREVKLGCTERDIFLGSESQEGCVPWAILESIWHKNDHGQHYGSVS